MQMCGPTFPSRPPQVGRLSPFYASLSRAEQASLFSPPSPDKPFLLFFSRKERHDSVFFFPPFFSRLPFDPFPLLPRRRANDPFFSARQGFSSLPPPPFLRCLLYERSPSFLLMNPQFSYRPPEAYPLGRRLPLFVASCRTSSFSPHEIPVPLLVPYRRRMVRGEFSPLYDREPPFFFHPHPVEERE